MIKREFSFLVAAYTAVVVLFAKCNPFVMCMMFCKPVLSGTARMSLDQSARLFLERKNGVNIVFRLIGLSLLFVLPLVVFWIICPSILTTSVDEFLLASLLIACAPVFEVLAAFFLVVFLPLSAVLFVTLLAPRGEMIGGSLVVVELFNRFLDIASNAAFRFHVITLKGASPTCERLSRTHRQAGLA